MGLQIDKCRKTPEMTLKWMNLREDAKQTLKIAFESAISSPKFVTKYKVCVFNKNLIGSEIHYLEIGYAIFTLVTIPGLPVILADVQINDGWPLYSL